MKLYVIRRPEGWGTPQELAAAAARSKHVGEEEMPEDVRWIRSYVVHERGGGLAKIREHAKRAGIPATDIFEVADTVIIRPDPVAVAA
jgi:hypothetical protein